jgi:outer membrane protein OmpA-like peptidoglycan-associated protein
MTRSPAAAATRKLAATTRKLPATTRKLAATTRGLAAAICLLLGVAGCTLGHQAQATSRVTFTEPTAGSVLVAAVDGPAAGPSLARLIAATARPGEDVDVLEAGATAAVLAAATSPPPARTTAPGRPAPPGGGATPFQQAEYHRSLARWKGEAASAKLAVTARTDAALAAWTSALDIAGKVGRLPGPARPAGSLASESGAVASALAGLGEAAGASFGGRRVVVLYASSLDGAPPPGELSGDDVIVVTSFLPSAAAISSAQASLLAAGATRASILGPESTPAQLAQLVALGLSQKVVTETLSGAALFANDSAQLTPGATRVLAPVIAPLRQPGATAVINGYASTPGSSQANYLLSYARAAAVAAFLEAHGIPASSLDIIGHGATGLVAAGSSGANRRVVVVIAEPAAPGRRMIR